jgi:hypothetical protein
LIPTVKAGNFVIGVYFRRQTVKILGAPGWLSLTVTDFAPKTKDKNLIFYFFYIL